MSFNQNNHIEYKVETDIKKFVLYIKYISVKVFIKMNFKI